MKSTHFCDEPGNPINNYSNQNAVEYGTHTMRRKKVTLIYQKTKNLRVLHLLLGHSKLESRVRYLDVEVDDALEASEQMEV